MIETNKKGTCKNAQKKLYLKKCAIQKKTDKTRKTQKETYLYFIIVEGVVAWYGTV